MHIASWMERVDLREEIQEVYIHSFLFKLGVKLVAIFLPFYILGLGMSIETVFYFYLINYGMYLVFSYFNARICSRLGYKHTMLLASPLILIFYLGLRAVESRPLLLLLAVLGGFSFNLYWMGMNPEVGKSSRSNSRQEDTGFFFSMPSLASILSPVVGGLILSVFDFNTLFISSATLVGVSFLPFAFSREHYSGLDVELRDFLKDASIDDYFTFFFKGVNSIGSKVIWPTYLAVIIGGSLNIGGAGSLQALGAAFTSIFIGSILNTDNRKKVIAIGIAIAAATFIAMSFVINPFLAFIVSLLNGLSYTAASIPIYSSALDHAEKEDLIEYFAVREFVLGLGRVSILLLTLSIFIYSEGNHRFVISFFVVALSVIATGYFGSKMEG